MQKNIVQVVWSCLLIGSLSMIYYLSLLLHLPVVLPLLLTAAFGHFSYRWLGKYATGDAPLPHTRDHTMIAYTVLIAGIVIITNKVYYIEQHYGQWDAWAIWNYHAKMLADPVAFKYLFDIPDGHPEYPLLLPSVIAFFWRLTASDNMVVPYLFSFFTTLIIPVTIYLALYRRNIIVASVILLLLATDDFYLERGVAQYADLPLALFFLCAVICLEYVPRYNQLVVVIAALLGCCMWTKNEGIMLSALFILFNIKTLLANGRWKYFLAGIALPLLVLLLFKAAAPPTDIIKDQSGALFSKLMDGKRYNMVWQHFSGHFSGGLWYIRTGLILYAALCIAERRWPHRNVWMLLACMAGFWFVYITTPRELDWHLHTSSDRVLMQLMPALVYLLGSHLSRVRLSLAQE